MEIDPIRPEIVPTEDGSPTLRHPALGETYHSLRGAVGESEHVFIRAGFDRVDRPHLRIFEMGFGTGLNALLTLRRAHEAGKTVEYLAVECYPVASEVASALGYVAPDDCFFAPFEAMHRAPWGEAVEIDPRFGLTKVCGSLPEIEFDTIFDVIYFDAFAPDTQPELWTEAIFRRLYEHTAPGGVLVTYSAKGTVKQALRSAGYRVERLPGALGKRHMIRAVKEL